MTRLLLVSRGALRCIPVKAILSKGSARYSNPCRLAGSSPWLSTRKKKKNYYSIYDSSQSLKFVAHHSALARVSSMAGSCQHAFQSFRATRLQNKSKLAHFPRNLHQRDN
jgi:hypothetical protein